MKNTNNLSDLSEGQYGTVLKTIALGAMRRRLQDIGLLEGARVQCLCRAPLGDPTAYQICGAVIALRCEDSEKVLINPL